MVRGGGWENRASRLSQSKANNMCARLRACLRFGPQRLRRFSTWVVVVVDYNFWIGDVKPRGTYVDAARNERGVVPTVKQR